MKKTSRFPSLQRAQARRPVRAGTSQQGVLLIEVMCAILIFSFGVLGLIGLQASSVSQSTDAKYRTAAAELADQLINQMWVSNRRVDTATTAFQPLFATGGTVYTAWLGNATTPGTVMATLPGVSAANSTLPTVSFPANLVPTGCSTVTPITCTSSVTVTVKWMGPKDTSSHQYVVNAQISLYSNTPGG